MSTLTQILLFIAIGITEFALSWLNHRINLSVLHRQKKIATRLDLMANTLAEVISFVIYVTTRNWIFIIPRIIGNTMGTRTVAGRKLIKQDLSNPALNLFAKLKNWFIKGYIKRGSSTNDKPTSRKKTPFTTA